MISFDTQLQIEQIVSNVLSDKGRTKPLVVERIGSTPGGRAAVSVQTEAGVNTLAKWFKQAGAKDISITTNMMNNSATVEFTLDSEFRLMSFSAGGEQVISTHDDLGGALKALEVELSRAVDPIDHYRNGVLIEFCTVENGHITLYKVMEAAKHGS